VTLYISRLFFGKIKQRLIGLVNARQSRASVHDKTDLFSHLPVNVTEDGTDIYDGLSGYFDDVVDFQGEKARMEMSLVKLPPILQIQLQASLNLKCCSIILTGYSVSNLTVKHCNLISRKPTLSSGETSTWIDSWTMQHLKRSSSPKLFKYNLMLVERGSGFFQREK